MSRFIPFVLILVAIGIFFGYIKPTWQGEVAIRKAEINSYESALAAANQFTEKQAELEHLRNQIPQEQLQRLDAFLPDSVDNVQLILDLNALATRVGVTLSDFETSEEVNGEEESQGQPGAPELSLDNYPTDSLTISVTATGTYSAFRSFLAGIEQSLRPLDIESIEVSESDTGVYAYHITVKFYWLH